MTVERLRELLEENAELIAALRNATPALLRVVEVARCHDDECANFPPDSELNCYEEPPEGWGVNIDPCLHCALAALDKEGES